MKEFLRIFGIVIGVLAGTLPYCSDNSAICSSISRGVDEVVKGYTK